MKSSFQYFAISIYLIIHFFAIFFLHLKCKQNNSQSFLKTLTGNEFLDVRNKIADKRIACFLVLEKTSDEHEMKENISFQLIL